MVTPKTRKRKKAPSTSEMETEKPQLSSPLALIHTSSPPVQPKIIFTGQLASGTSLVTTTSPIPSYPVASAYTPVGPIEHNKTFSEDASTKVDQSKLHAEDAAAQAAAAVKYSQNVWAHLAAQRNSGLTSDIEQKLVSAVVAAAAAAVVAKAAAAAAKVASEAALQAKMIAEESAMPLMSENTGPLGSVQTSFIAMAKETAKKRVESASAAAKRAENLDAVIRAAEVVAEAVSQAGVLVAMGDPLPLGIKELLEAGPEGYWKVHFSKTEKEKQLPGTTSTLQPDFEEARPENQEKVKEKSSSIQQVPRNTDAGNTFEPLCLLFHKFNCWQTHVFTVPC
jgi:predicted small secreted protein